MESAAIAVMFGIGTANLVVGCALLARHLLRLASQENDQARDLTKKLDP